MVEGSQPLQHLEDWKYLKYLQIDVGESVRVDISTHTDDPLVTKLWTFQGWNSLEVLEVYIHDWRENANSPSQVICITPLDLPDIAICKMLS